MFQPVNFEQGFWGETTGINNRFQRNRARKYRQYDAELLASDDKVQMTMVVTKQPLLLSAFPSSAIGHCTLQPTGHKR